MIITTIYQKFISRYAATFTLIEEKEMADNTYDIRCEIVPSERVAHLTEEEFDELFNELMDSENQKASWSDSEEEPFDEEDSRAEFHQKWDEIDNDIDNIGL